MPSSYVCFTLAVSHTTSWYALDVEVAERHLPYHSLNKAGQPDAQQRTSEYELTKLPRMASLTPQVAIVGMQFMVCLRAFTTAVSSDHTSLSLHVSDLHDV